MRDSVLVQEEEAGDPDMETQGEPGDRVRDRRKVKSLLQLAADNLLEKFVPPR